VKTERMGWFVATLLEQHQRMI